MVHTLLWDSSFFGCKVQSPTKLASKIVKFSRARSKEYTTAQLQLLLSTLLQSSGARLCTYVLDAAMIATLLQLIILIVSYQLCPSTGLQHPATTTCYQQSTL